MRKPLLVLVIACFLIINVGGQDNGFTKVGLIKATTTISPGFMLSETGNNIYLHGHLEYYPEEKVSLRGDSYIFLDAQDETPLFDLNHSILFGCLYHFKENSSFDPYVGFEPGVSLTRKPLIFPGPAIDPRLPVTTANPIISLTAGTNYFVGNNFNFFLSLRYVKGRMLRNIERPVKLDELRLSFGLGFNLSTRKNR